MDLCRSTKLCRPLRDVMRLVVLVAVVCTVMQLAVGPASADRGRDQDRPTELRSWAVPETEAAPVETPETPEAPAAPAEPSEAVPVEEVQQSTTLQTAAQFLPRIGVAANRNPRDYEQFSQLDVGWFHNWSLRPFGLTPIDGLDFYPTLATWGELWGNETEATIRDHVTRCPACYPAGTIWIVSNELEYDYFDTINGEPIPGGSRPITPDEYAQKYKKYYDIIKGINPTYLVAVGATYDDPSWPDEDRCQVLPRAMQAYENRYGAKMPIDVYTMHAYMDQVSAPNYQVEIMVQRKRQLMKTYGD